MSDQQRSDRLSLALRELKRRPASDGFTDRVLSDLDARDARVRRRRALRATLAAAAAVVVVVGAAWLTLRPSVPPATGASAEARTEDLRREQRQLKEELERLQRASERTRPVLYLASGDDYDLVLDLSPLLEPQAATPMVPALQDLRVRRPEAREAVRRQP